MKTQTLRERARHRKPAAPKPMPVTIVGSAGTFLTARLTRIWRRMIVPPLMTVTCSASNFSGTPNEAKSRFTGVPSTKSRRNQRTDPKFWK